VSKSALDSTMYSYQYYWNHSRIEVFQKNAHCSFAFFLNSYPLYSWRI